MLPPQYTSPFKTKVELPPSKGRPIDAGRGRKALFAFMICLSFFGYGLWHVEDVESIDKLKQDVQGLVKTYIPQSLLERSKSEDPTPSQKNGAEEDTMAAQDSFLNSLLGDDVVGDWQGAAQDLLEKGALWADGAWQNVLQITQNVQDESLRFLETTKAKVLQTEREKQHTQTAYKAEKKPAQATVNPSVQRIENTSNKPDGKATYMLSDGEPTPSFQQGMQVEVLLDPTPFYTSPKHQSERGAVAKGSLLKVEAVRAGWLGIKGGNQWFWLKQGDVRPAVHEK